MNFNMIMYIALLVLGVALAWGFLTDWTFSGLLPREGARCTPGDDKKDVNAEQHVYDENKECTVVHSCKPGWKPDASKTACISSISGMLCDFKGTKIANGVYRYSPQNVCELSGCTDGLVVDNGKCVALCEGKDLTNVGDVDTAFTCGLLVGGTYPNKTVCWKVDGESVVEKTNLDFTSVGDAQTCVPAETVYIRNQQGKDIPGLQSVTSFNNLTLEGCRNKCENNNDCTGGFSYTRGNGSSLSQPECILRKDTAGSDGNTDAVTDTANNFVFYRKHEPLSS